MAQSGWTDKRPMSPHVQVWRWHTTMLGSILHRATGVANYLGLILLAGWLFAAASGPEAYSAFERVASSIPGSLVLFGFTVSILYHAMSGARHLVWDAGHGFNPKLASLLGGLMILLAAVGAGAIWIAAGLAPVSLQALGG